MTDQIDQNPDLQKVVEPSTEVKEWLVNYVGNQFTQEFPGNDDVEVTVEMIIEVVSKEFPEFLLCVAEENFIRGYQQALNDVEEGEKLFKEHSKKDNA